MPLNHPRWPAKTLPIALLSLLLVACATLAPDYLAPAKSPNDARDYRLLTLDNQLQVLLISDPNSPTAAAALDIDAGSGDNPPGRDGLAHFLEHMLFLGTDKYPDPAAYEQFVTEHGGDRNAYTSFEHTNYFFDVDAPYLDPALDRFAQFFVAPRFDAEYVEREKNAVEAEYQMGLKSDPRRALDVLQDLINPEHPFSRFTVGSLETLADRPGAPVRDDLLAFYDSHYSANRMRLVVLGSESLDELQSMVEPKFAPVRNQSLQAEDISAPLFTPAELPLYVQIRPQAALRELQVMFPIPDYRDAYRSQPLAYLGNLVGHEGEGSLLSRLKAEGLAESLAAGTGLAWRGGGLFSVTVTLTEKGVTEHERVLQLLFAYLDMLREAGPKQWLYDEQSRLAALAFRFKEKGSAIGYVSQLADSMHEYAPADVLRGLYMMEDYDPEMLAGLLDAVRPQNAVVVLEDASVETDLESRYYQTPYAVEKFAGTVPEAWRRPVQADLFHLPAPNEFIPEDVSLVALDPNNPPVPAKVFDAPRREIWFAQDAQFRLPRGATYVNFRSPLVGQTAREAASAALYVSLLNDRVNELVYPASLAGLNFNLYKHAQGISVRVSGYTDKQSLLLDELLGVFRAPGFDPARFENIRQDRIRALRNAVAAPPSQQVMNDLRESLLHGSWGEVAMIAALEELSLADIQAYAADFWRSASAQALVYGNYSRDAVTVLAGQLETLLPAAAPAALPPLKVVELGAGESVLYPVEVSHDDALLAWYLQGAGNSWFDRAATAMTGQLVKSGFFQQLRTEQQLGYIVSAFSWPQLDVPGLVMLIQSPVADTAALATAMDTFMRGVPGTLDEAQFERNKRALVNEILRPHQNLWQRAEFYWQSIAKQQYRFDSRDALAAAVEALTLAQWQDYYRQTFLEERHSLQVAAPGAAGVLPEGAARTVESAEALKRGHPAYELP
ncbi:peptidase M16 [Mangrovimicrobium sediminis]|uniref:Protease 3 n=1 Tax=Mangrovimicrobium sediminis TaxID=2562682 RepID=A0A4Z0M3V4_9GAMM|nr:insulinase family protein [Haliea sp. SAOS-164]TGD74117.1 peptidase M16 [Haliea sp. SAOS-164]